MRVAAISLNMNEKLLNLKDIQVYYGPDSVLNHVSLSLYSNEILGIRGENGAGKSTLMRLMAGVMRQNAGTREVNPSLKNRICYVPQEISLYPTLTGRQNLSFWAEIYGLHGKSKELRIRYLLKLMNLESKAKKRVETYSGGMKRRLNMAASLVITPGLLLLDEPTVGADTRS
ncbi:MAG: ABC transporter ATP-binding protein, partial [Clostridia bacterium]|nr:ABC transporter ATP-binding protein [Clostridia bacterium]